MARHLSQFLAGFSFNTRVRHPPRLTGGENAHFLPVIRKLGAAIQADHISSRVRRRLTATVSPLAGLGKADAFVPGPEQSVENLHHLLLPSNLGKNLGSHCMPDCQGRYLRYLLISAFPPGNVSCILFGGLTKNGTFLVHRLLSIR